MIRQIIKRQLILVGCLLALSILTVVSWAVLIWVPQYKDEEEGCSETKFLCLEPKKGCQEYQGDNARILLSFLVFFNGFFDALAWYLLHRLTNSKELKIKKTINLTDMQSVLMANSPMSEISELVENEKTDKNEENEQNVSDALRKEVITYMTKGLERSLYNTSKETYERYYSYGDLMEHLDEMQTYHDDDDEDTMRKLSKKSNAGVSNSKSVMRSKLELLALEEPEPPSAQYPINIHHDPKTHKGVINQIYISLESKQLMSLNDKLVATFKKNIAVSSCDDAGVYSEDHLENVNVHQNNHEKKEDDDALLSGLNGKKNQDTDENEHNLDEMDMYSSGISTVDDVELNEMSMDKKEKQIMVESKTKLQQLSDEPDLYKQPSQGSMILSSITRTISRVANTLNTDHGSIQHQPDTFNTTYTSMDSMNDPRFDHDDEMYETSNDQNIKDHGVPFKDYAPHVFRYLRQQIYGIPDEEYLLSVSFQNEAQRNSVQEKFSEGRSGAFFFFTHDSKYIIKTVTKAEASLLLKMLPSFVEHYAKNPHTLINRFFGLHSLTMYNLVLYFVVLENVFVAGSKPHECYDIKGSWIDRHTNHHVESGKLMKDQDLHKTLKLMPSISASMYKQLRADSKFLCSQNIMDYSVLLGIYYVGIDPSDVHKDRIMNAHHDNASHAANDSYTAPEFKEFKADLLNISRQDSDPEVSMNDREHTIRNMPNNMDKRPRAPSLGTGIKKFATKDKAVTARVIEGPGVYFLGIIDVLQEWDWNKRMERWFKVYFRCKSGDGISCVEPEYYRKRFMRKMYRIGIKPLNSRHRTNDTM